jgi:anti-anti-sigma factor
MEITESDAHGVILAACFGRLDMGSAAAAEASLLALVGQRKPVLLDLAGLGYISSAGLRVILKVAKEAKLTGHGFALAAPQPNVQEVLEVSGFPKMVPLHATRADGLAALRLAL